MRKSIIGATCACLAVVSFSTDAAVVGRLAATPGGTDYQAYYDTEANLTWLADANYAQTSGYDADGRMTWVDANAWAAGLSIGGVSGWRLADTDASCGYGRVFSGFTCPESEMWDLFVNTLGFTGHDLPSTPFSNIQFDYYWTATEWVHANELAWTFDMLLGGQDNSSKDSVYYGWAVQSGDVSAVPVPAAVWLFGSGLIGLVGVARRKTNA